MLLDLIELVSFLYGGFGVCCRVLVAVGLYNIGLTGFGVFGLGGFWFGLDSCLRAARVSWLGGVCCCLWFWCIIYCGWWWFCLTRVELLVGLVWVIAGLSYCCIVCFGLAGFWFAVDCVV